MNNRKTALFGAVIAIAAGLFGANAAQINTQSAITNSLAEGTPIYGHITLVAKDSQGHVTAYRQTDNLIVNQGLNCMAYALFRVAATGGLATNDRNNCGGSGSATFTSVAAFNTISGFRWIQIGGINTASATSTQATIAPDQTNAALYAPFTNTAGAGSAVPVLTPLGTATSGSGGTGTGAVVSIVVPNLAPTISSTIAEAGLFDQNAAASATGANMFARQTFPAITMGSADTLQVTWTITLAHS